MALGAPLLSIIRNAAEWLADANDSVTLLLSSTKNVFNGDTECYPSLAFMVHSVFWLVWSHSEMESSSTHSVYSFESVETTVIVISCGRASSGLELISALDKALPMFDLRDTECYRSSALKTVQPTYTTSDDGEPADGAFPDVRSPVDHHDGNRAAFSCFRLRPHCLVRAHGVG